MYMFRPRRSFGDKQVGVVEVYIMYINRSVHIYVLWSVLRCRAIFPPYLNRITNCNTIRVILCKWSCYISCLMSVQHVLLTSSSLVWISLISMTIGFQSVCLFHLWLLFMAPMLCLFHLWLLFMAPMLCLLHLWLLFMAPMLSSLRSSLVSILLQLNTTYYGVSSVSSESKVHLQLIVDITWAQ